MIRGERTVEVEPGGPPAATFIDTFVSYPPTELAGEPVQEVARTDSGDELVIRVEGAELTVRSTDGPDGLLLTGNVDKYGSYDSAADRRWLIALLDALTSTVADPERQRFLAELSGGRIETGFDFNALQSLSREQALALAIRSIDLTTLAGDDTPGRVRALCAQAVGPDPTDPSVGPVAAVCVYPNLVRTAVALLEGSPVEVASVATAFPSGLSSLDVRLRDIDDVIAAGAGEVDVVINRSAFLVGDHDTVRTELRVMREHIGDRSMKVILETSELPTPAAIHAAARLAIDAGAEWIKTSTGKTSVGATHAAVSTMCRAVADHVALGGDPVGIKVSGGVRTGDDALGYLAIIERILGPEWLDPSRIRFGASGLLGALVNELAR